MSCCGSKEKAGGQDLNVVADQSDSTNDLYILFLDAASDGDYEAL